jgi:hypothetical protein
MDASLLMHHNGSQIGGRFNVANLLLAEGTV